ncbi:Uncharacterised protein [Vibrio cholerae]|nr:Uncharacterised protein [Vibrio cholerae]
MDNSCVRKNQISIQSSRISCGAARFCTRVLLVGRALHQLDNNGLHHFALNVSNP